MGCANFATGLRHPGVNQLNARFQRIDNCRQIGCHDCSMATTTLLGFFLSTLLFKTTDGGRAAIGEASCYFSRWQVVQQCAVSFRQEQESHHHHVRVPTPTPPARAFSSSLASASHTYIHLPSQLVAHSSLPRCLRATHHHNGRNNGPHP